jgi:hypothetical protein
MAEKKGNLNEIRITNLSSKTFSDIKNIAENSGVTMSNLLRPQITKIAESYPDRMKLPPKKD